MHRIRRVVGKIDSQGFTDFELVNAARQGSVDAFAAIVDRYKDRIVSYLYRYTGNRETAEDLAQEAFVRVWRKFDMYNPTLKFSTWLYTIAINLAKDEFKRVGRSPSCTRMEFAEDGGRGSSDPRLSAESQTPSSALERSERRDVVREMMNGLESEERAIMILRDIQGFSYREIADMLSIPMGTVKSRINRSRFALKAIYQELYGNELL